ncbi:MAG TPA: hypothetical protein VGQ49_04985 [Bryobacteraceae bacterium]|jgi:hypothetical protein|nr:hypothetical protein [Bryobacteraceae bacterium]
MKQGVKAVVRAAAVLLALAVPACWAQAVISARSGLVNYVAGDVQLEGQPVKLDGAIFPNVKVGQTLSTGMGHAEVLLTPGVFLRLDRNTSFRMVSDKLTNTQVEILRGSAMVEADEMLKDNRIAVKLGDSDTLLVKTGLYHFNAEAGQIRTFTGKAQVSDGSNSTELKGGRTLLVGSSLTADKFNKNKSKDELYAWSAQRDYLLERANISSARTQNSKGLSASLWSWNPGFGMFTFLPSAGYVYSPFGMYWYSPASVWIVSQPVGYGGYGGNGGGPAGNTSASTSSVGNTSTRESTLATRSSAGSPAMGSSPSPSSGMGAASAGARSGPSGHR